MKWAFSIENKIKASIILIALCSVVLFSNFRLKRLSSKVANSVQTIYEDRLIVQDLIFSFDQILDERYHINEQMAQHTGNNQAQKKVEELKLKYLSTIMTEEEERVFNSFSSNLTDVLTLDDTVELKLFNEMRSELQRLEQIQMEEAKRQMNIIHKTRAGQELGFYFETAIIVVLLVIVQFLIISNTSIKKLVDKSNFNYN